jgi:hypothetical protein
VSQPPGINNCKVHYENCTVLYRQECRIMACTYLNSRLLGAPCEYVLHGLDPHLDWASFWPSTPRVFHVATPYSVSCCLSKMDRVSHLTPSLLPGWLLTNVIVNNTTTLYDTHGHTYIHHIGITILLFFFLLILLPPFLAGWLVQTLPLWYTNFEWLNLERPSLQRATELRKWPNLEQLN